MFLYLMRHAEAERMGGTIKNDADRPLTEYGRFQAKAVAAELNGRVILPVVLCSPLTRAVQTATILCDVLGLGAPQQEPLLSSKGYAPDLSAILRSHPTAESVLLIGHQPDIGMLVGQVLGFELGFGTATIAAFASDMPSQWRFLWTRTPEDLLKKK